MQVWEISGSAALTRCCIWISAFSISVFLCFLSFEWTGAVLLPVTFLPVNPSQK